MLAYSQKSDCNTFIVATETGILHKMKELSPNKQFIIASSTDFCNCNDCQYMKLNTLEKIYNCLAFDTNEIFLDENIIKDAKTSILRMLELSK